MKAGTKVKMTKMAENKPGHMAIGYTEESMLSNDVEVGKRVYMGDWTLVTSPVKSINEIEPGMIAAETENSTWKIEEVR